MRCAVSFVQAHGFGVRCLLFPKLPQFQHRLVSGADEKILRVFDAPLNFIRLLAAVNPSAAVPLRADDAVRRVEQAFIPELALSNKVWSAAVLAYVAVLSAHVPTFVFGVCACLCFLLVSF